MATYLTSDNKLDLQALTAELLSMHRAVMRNKKSFQKDAALPALVRQTYQEAHVVAMERAFDL